jgi:hypothetical protein
MSKIREISVVFPPEKTSRPLARLKSDQKDKVRGASKSFPKNKTHRAANRAGKIFVTCGIDCDCGPLPATIDAPGRKKIYGGHNNV